MDTAGWADVITRGLAKLERGRRVHSNSLNQITQQQFLKPDHPTDHVRISLNAGIKTHSLKAVPASRVCGEPALQEQGGPESASTPELQVQHMQHESYSDAARHHCKAPRGLPAM